METDDEILVLWGLSGVGKTTALNCLAGLERISFGFIQLNGRLLASPAEGINLPARRRNIGYVLQDYGLHNQWQIPCILVTHDREDAQILGDRTIVLT